jgi:hypothetical protein
MAERLHNVLLDSNDEEPKKQEIEIEEENDTFLKSV